MDAILEKTWNEDEYRADCAEQTKLSYHVVIVPRELTKVHFKIIVKYIRRQNKADRASLTPEGNQLPPTENRSSCKSGAGAETKYRLIVT